jgi:hypothetical protein
MAQALTTLTDADLDTLDEWAYEVGNEPVLALIADYRKLRRVAEAAHEAIAIGTWTQTGQLVIPDNNERALIAALAALEPEK